MGGSVGLDPPYLLTRSLIHTREDGNPQPVGLSAEAGRGLHHPLPTPTPPSSSSHTSFSSLEGQDACPLPILPGLHGVFI